MPKTENSLGSARIRKERHILGEIWSAVFDFKKRTIAAGILQFMNLKTEVSQPQDVQKEQELSHSVAALKCMSRQVLETDGFAAYACPYGYIPPCLLLHVSSHLLIFDFTIV